MGEEHQAILYDIPKPRQEWISGKFVKKSESNEEAWVALFIDLVYVVLLSKLGALMYYCERSVFLYLKLSIFFWSLCLTRHAIDEYANRFYSPDLLHKVIYLVYTVGIIIQVLNINHSSDHHGCDFSPEFGLGMIVGIIITRVSIIAIYGVVMSCDPIARKQFMFDIIRWSLTICLMLLRIIMSSYGIASNGIDLIIIGVSVVQETGIWIIARAIFRHFFVYPVDLEALQSRWGVWVMIVIGESIIQMLSIPLSLSHLWSTYYLTVVAVILMFSLGMQYYDACHVEWYNHALTKSAVAGISWIWLHVPMSYHLFRVGAGFETLFHDMHDDHHLDKDFMKLFSVSLGVVTFLLTLIRLTNTNFEGIRNPYDLAKFLSRLFFSGLQISVMSWHLETPIDFLLVHACISVCAFNVLDVVYDLLALGWDDSEYDDLEYVEDEEEYSDEQDKSETNSMQTGNQPDQSSKVPRRNSTKAPRPSSKLGLISNKFSNNSDSGRIKKGVQSNKSAASGKSSHSSGKVTRMAEELRKVPRQWSNMHLTRAKSEASLRMLQYDLTGDNSNEGDDRVTRNHSGGDLPNNVVGETIHEDNEEHELSESRHIDISNNNNNNSELPVIREVHTEDQLDGHTSTDGDARMISNDTGDGVVQIVHHDDLNTSSKSIEPGAATVNNVLHRKEPRIHPVLTRRTIDNAAGLSGKNNLFAMSGKNPKALSSKRLTLDSGDVEMSYDGFVFTVNNEKNKDVFKKKKHDSDISFRRNTSNKASNSSSKAPITTTTTANSSNETSSHFSLVEFGRKSLSMRRVLPELGSLSGKSSQIAPTINSHNHSGIGAESSNSKAVRNHHQQSGGNSNSNHKSKGNNIEELSDLAQAMEEEDAQQ